jgi:hypothetical protein
VDGALVDRTNKSISSSAQHIILHSIKAEEEKSKYAGLAQEIGFGSASLEGLLGLVNGAATLYTCIQSVINMT